MPLWRNFCVWLENTAHDNIQDGQCLNGNCLPVSDSFFNCRLCLIICLLFLILEFHLAKLVLKGRPTVQMCWQLDNAKLCTRRCCVVTVIVSVLCWWIFTCAGVVVYKNALWLYFTSFLTVAIFLSLWRSCKVVAVRRPAYTLKNMITLRSQMLT